MFRTLSSQLAITIGIVFLITTIGLFQWFLHSSHRFGDEVAQGLHRTLAEKIIHDDAALSRGVIQQDQLKNVFHMQMLLGPDWEFYALDTQGKVLAYSAPTSVVKRDYVALDPIRQFIHGENFPLYGDDPRHSEVNKIFSAAEIIRPEGEVVGYLYVIIGGEKRDALESLLAGSKVLTDSALIIGATLLFGLFALIFAILKITQPLKELSKRCQYYVDNQFRSSISAHEPIKAAKEIQNLEHCFDNTANHINNQLAQIKTTEQLRRELLSHISHDFHTPLTALNGYLETWLITEERKRTPELIETALKNGYQIKMLVDQLFELARLEIGENRFNPEPVNVLELAHDVMQRLRFQANKRNVSLSVDKHYQHNVQVMADISKLERILVNLIDNAIRHTPENGHVSIYTSNDDNQVVLHVADTGTGIPEQELKSVFEPKYRASNALGNSIHAGLGLTIVKQLLAMHNSTIRVKNQPQSGCCFSFALPRAA